MTSLIKFTTLLGLFGVSMEFFRGHTDIFQSPEKWCFPCAVAIKFPPVTGYGLKFVKMKFLVKSILLWQQ